MVTIINSKICKDLANHGCLANKTFTLEFPNIDKQLIPHFIRGYFDGDGTVYYRNTSTKIGIQAAFVGRKSFLEKIAENLNFVNCVYKEERNGKNVWYLKLQSNSRALKLYHYMYKDSNNLNLSRKREKFENFIKDRRSTTIIADPTKRNFDYMNQCYLED